MPYVSTTKLFTVTNITLTRTADLATASINTLANLLGTLIYDVQAGTYDGSAYALTNGVADTAYDADSTSLNELLNVFGTVIDQEGGDEFTPHGFTVANYAPLYVLNCTSTSLNELAKVLAALLRNWRFIATGSLNMASIQLYQYFSIDTGESKIQGGSLSKARSINLVDDEVTDQTFKVAPATAVKIWDKTENEAMSNWDFLWLESDLDVLVQFTTDAAGTDVYDVKELKGSGVSGEMGPAIVLGSDDTLLLDGAIDAFTGTANTIDEIWVYNADDTDTARVRLVVAT